MVLLLIKSEFNQEILIDELIKIEGLLKSLENQDGYCTHSVNIEQKREKQLLLIVEWKNEVAAKNYLQTEECKLLVEALKKIGKKYSSYLAGVLSRGEIEIVKEQISLPPIFETS